MMSSNNTNPLTENNVENEWEDSAAEEKSEGLEWEDDNFWTGEDT